MTLAVWFGEAIVLQKRAWSFLLLALYTALLSVQLTCILLTGSRGPWLGLLCGLFIFALLWAVTRRRWGLATLASGLGLSLAFVLVLVAIPGSPLSAAREIPLVGRLSRVFESTGRVRLVTWEGTVDLLASEPRRAVFGYGPETMHLVYTPFYPAELGRLEHRDAVPDRAHNETFDALVTSGSVGLVLQLLLLSALFYSGLRSAGALRSGARSRLFLSLWVGGGLAGVVLLCLPDRSWRFFGVGLPLGLLAGLVAFLVARGFRGFLGRPPEAQQESSDPSSLLAVALVSALAAHWCEISFGLAVTATRTYFWVYAALLVVGSRFRAARIDELNTPPVTASEIITHDSAGVRTVMSGGLVAALILVTLVYGYVSPNLERAHTMSVAWLLSFTWAFVGLMTLAKAASENDQNPASRALPRLGGIYVAVTVLATLGFAGIQEVTRYLAKEPTDLLVSYHGALTLVLLLLAGALGAGLRSPARWWSRPAIWASPVVVVGCALLALHSNLDPVRADVYHRAATRGYSRGIGYEAAVALGRKAVELDPNEPRYHHALGTLALKEAKRRTDSGERDALFTQAASALERARDLRPRQPRHVANLARLHAVRSHYTEEANEKKAYLTSAADLYAQATKLHPHNALLWVEWGRVRSAAGERDQALAKYLHALQLDDTYEDAHLELGLLYLGEKSWKEAAKALERAVAGGGSHLAHRSLANAYLKLNRISDAVVQYHLALERSPRDTASHEALARIYRAAGRVDEAQLHAKRALELAPEKAKPALEALRDALRRESKKDADAGPEEGEAREE